MKQKTIGNIIIISIVPRFDSVTALPVEQELKEVLMSGVQNIVCDLTETEYIASAGLRVLLSTAKAVQRQGGKFVLCSIRPKVQEIFDIAGFSQIFTLYHSVDEAVAALTG